MGGNGLAEPGDVDGLYSSILMLCWAGCRLQTENNIVMALISFYFIKPKLYSVGASARAANHNYA